MTTNHHDNRLSPEPDCQIIHGVNETLDNLMRSSDRLQNLLGKFLREQGLTLPQFNVLRILQTEGRRLPCLAIADRMLQVVPAITGILDRLEANGWVQRHRCLEDRRVIFVELTRTGSDRLDQLNSPYGTLQRKLLENLTESERRTLNQLLAKIDLCEGQSKKAN